MRSRTLPRVVVLAEEARLRAVHTALLESEDVHHLHVFDMDGTLVRSAEDTRENKDLFRYSTRHRLNPQGDKPGDWWGDHRTLRHPFEAPPIEHTLKHYHAAKASPNSRVVVMTGRVHKPDMADAVSQTLHRVGVRGLEHGKDLFLKPPQENKKKPTKTTVWKEQMLKQWHREHPNLQHIHLWDDRPEHLEHFGKVLHKLGVKHSLHHVQAPGWGGSTPEHS